MTTPHRCALIGFSVFEYKTFAAFFKLTARRFRGCKIYENVDSCEVAVVNADDNAALSAFVATNPRLKVLLIGKNDAGTGWPILARPIRLMGILGALDKQLGGTVLVPLASAAQTPAALPASTAPPAAQRKPTEIHAPTARVNSTAIPTGTSSAPQRKRSAGSSNFGAPSSFMGLEATSAKSATTASASRFDDILVVDDSDVALKFMQSRLHRFGFRPELVSSGEEAVVRVTNNDFKFVFLDVMMQGMDGYQTCRAIKQRNYNGATPPVVVMLTSRGGTIDKIRGTLAGCDAYLTKPLNEAALLAVLSKHDPQVQRGFQATSIGTPSDK